MHLVTLLCKLSGHQADVKCALFLHGDTHMVTGGADNILCVWDVQERQRTQVLEGHTNWIYGLCQHMVDDVLASGSDDCTIRLWDTKTFTCTRVIACGAIVESICFAYDHVLVAGLSGTSVTAFDSQTGHVVQRYSAHSSSEYVYGLAVSPWQIPDDGMYRCVRCVLNLLTLVL